MSLVGTVESLWRYPVKSMRGEELDEAFFGFSGMYGDRLFAFRSTAAPKGFPFLTGREQEEMLLYRPRFRHPERAGKPPNLSEAESMVPGINPLFADAADLAVDVETPTGELLPVEDPRLMNLLPKRTGAGNVLTLLRSERAMTDCRPISLFSRPSAWRGDWNDDRQATIQDKYLIWISVLQRDTQRMPMSAEPYTSDRRW